MPEDDTSDWSWFNDPGPPSYNSNPPGGESAERSGPFIPGPTSGASSTAFEPSSGSMVGGAVTVRSPSRTLLWAGAGMAVVSLALIPVALRAPLVSVLGWLLGGFVAVGLVSLWSYQEAQARTNLWYLAVKESLPLRAVALGLCVLAVVVHSYLFADWASRR